MGVSIQEVIDFLTSPVNPVENTVDTLKFGSGDTVITGIAVSFMPTYNVIKQALNIGANLLITHEGAFFSHWDKNELGENEIILEKERLIEESGIAIFRLHDYIHKYKPDGIMRGLIQTLEWEPYVEEHLPVATILNIPTTTVQGIADYVKEKLRIGFVRSVGDKEMGVNRVGIFAGYRGGGATAIPIIEKYQLDLAIYGEGPEWETPEYVRDAIAQGKNKTVLVLGHAESEESGMKYLAQSIQENFPSVPTHFIPTAPLFNVL
ncbi:Nif3-like dinuclear metal center hexameric protein [Bacillus sinesaloumensis]|uniref:Nif3-like dinuclear metal center hexameric protein n=1 Tax=Litchfieldia sinesaloumensis TaxID=1926280 RepID=UPI0009884680|nr:Nif3-like dinuclear metal center hexameric protein [Bacillus sinesaloumensis]